jgi:hypothetical protein
MEKRATASSSIARAVVEGEVREVGRVVDGLAERVQEQVAALELAVREWVRIGESSATELDALRRALAFTARWVEQLAEARASLGGATRGA